MKKLESGEPYGGRNREAYQELLEAKLRPAAIRSTLEFANLFLMAHELVKLVVIEKVHDFYDDTSGLGPEAKERFRREYAAKVLALSPGVSDRVNEKT